MTGPRIAREKRTVSAMVSIYCKDKHGGRGLCGPCSELLEYSKGKLDRCTFSESKPTCAKCPVHCYEPEMRERIRTVMRHSGPRMMLRHPVLAIMHSIDGRILRKTEDG